MATLSRYVVQLEANSAKYVAELEKANRSLDKFHKQQTKALDIVKRGLATLGVALSVRAFVGFIKSTIDAADHARDMSMRLGVAIETLQGLSLAAKLGGASAGELEVGLRQLNRAISDAATNGGAAKDMFDSLGVRVKDASGEMRGTEEVLRDVADGFAKMADGADKTTLATRLFGRSGSALIPVLNGGAAGIDKVIDRARRLGIIWSKDAADAADQFNDNLILMRALSDGFASSLAQGLLPALNAVTGAMVAFGEESQIGVKLGGFLGDVLKYLVAGVMSLSEAVVWLGDTFGATFAALAVVTDSKNLLRPIEAVQEAMSILAEYSETTAANQKKLHDALDIITGKASAAADELRALAAANGELEDGIGDSTTALGAQIKAVEAQIAVLRLGTVEAKVWAAKQAGSTDEAALALFRYALRLQETLQNEEALKKEGYELVKSLLSETKMLGLTGRAAELMRLRLKGMGEEQLLQVAHAMRVADALTAQYKAEERLARRQAMAGIKPLNPSTGKPMNVDVGTANQLNVPDLEGFKESYEQITEIQRENEDARLAYATNSMWAEFEMRQEIMTLSADLHGEQGEALLETLAANMEERMAIEEQLSERMGNEERKRLEVKLAAVNQSIEMVRQMADAEIAIRQAVTDAALGLLGAFANEHRGAAIALLVFQKAMAIKEIFVEATKAKALIAMNYTIAISKAFAELGPIAGAVAATALVIKEQASLIRVATAAKISAGLVAATGLVEASQLSHGGTQATRGTTANPINVTGSTASSAAASTPARGQRVTQVIFQGDMYGFDDYVRTRIIASIRDAVDESDVVIVGQNSRQARMLGRV